MKDLLHDQKGVVGVILLFLIVVVMFVFVGYRVHLARQNSTKANAIIVP
jgi:type VI protein secretion system component VasF